jgi:hypothetical protein
MNLTRSAVGPDPAGTEKEMNRDLIKPVGSESGGYGFEVTRKAISLYRNGGGAHTIELHMKGGGGIERWTAGQRFGTGTRPDSCHLHIAGFAGLTDYASTSSQ